VGDDGDHDERGRLRRDDDASRLERSASACF
jgi:hypothetical protein